MWKLYENFHIFHFQKRIVSAETIRENMVFQLQKNNSCHNNYLQKYTVITKYVSSVLTKNVHFRIPQEKWYIYPAWLFLYTQVIILPVILLSAIAIKILMKKEIKRYLFGNSIHTVNT